MAFYSFSFQRKSLFHGGQIVWVVTWFACLLTIIYTTFSMTQCDDKQVIFLFFFTMNWPQCSCEMLLPQTQTLSHYCLQVQRVTSALAVMMTSRIWTWWLPGCISIWLPESLVPPNPSTSFFVFNPISNQWFSVSHSHVKQVTQQSFFRSAGTKWLRMAFSSIWRQLCTFTVVDYSEPSKINGTDSSAVNALAVAWCYELESRGQIHFETKGNYEIFTGRYVGSRTELELFYSLQN